MDLVEEQGVIVSLHGGMASIAPLAQTGCKSCPSNGICGTSFLAPLFGKKQRLLVAKNIINAKPGDQVTIGLNRMALVFASLMVYILPLMMLVIGAILGEAFAHASGIEDTELVSILSGLGAASLTFLIISRVVRSASFSSFFEPVLLEGHLNR
jgi:sigma-E factor negative regulatory protein RseC